MASCLAPRTPDWAVLGPVRKAIFSPSVSKNGAVYTPETSCMKWNSVHIQNMWIKQLSNRKVRNFALALRARNVSGAFEKRAPRARFSKAPETFRDRKAIFRSFVSKNGEVYTPETSCMKGTSLHLWDIRIKQLYNRKVRDFAMALRARKVSRAFEKRAPGR